MPSQPQAILMNPNNGEPTPVRTGDASLTSA